MLPSSRRIWKKRSSVSSSSWRENQSPAQDFYRLFGLGEDDKHINTLDPDGVALAAIKALYEKSKRVDVLEIELAKLRELVEVMIANQD